MQKTPWEKLQMTRDTNFLRLKMHLPGTFGGKYTFTEVWIGYKHMFGGLITITNVIPDHPMQKTPWEKLQMTRDTRLKAKNHLPGAIWGVNTCTQRCEYDENLCLEAAESSETLCLTTLCRKPHLLKRLWDLCGACTFLSHTHDEFG